jgi:2-polyprenyl-3-methyl-5-hydroxy-6-metoxy-1,4-benzoquinol methylase
MKYTELKEDILEYHGYNDDKTKELADEYDVWTKNEFPKEVNEKTLMEYYSRDFSFSGLRPEPYSWNVLRDFEVTKICLMLAKYKVLDFGCGIGNSSIIAAQNGLDVTAVDVQGKTLDFVKFRNNKHKLNIKVITV